MDMQMVVNVVLVLGMIISGLSTVFLTVNYFTVSGELFQMELGGVLCQDQNPKYEAVWLVRLFMLRHVVLNLTIFMVYAVAWFETVPGDLGVFAAVGFHMLELFFIPFDFYRVGKRRTILNRQFEKNTRKPKARHFKG